MTWRGRSFHSLPLDYSVCDLTAFTPVEGVTIFGFASPPHIAIPRFPPAILHLLGKRKEKSPTLSPSLSISLSLSLSLSLAGTLTVPLSLSIPLSIPLPQHLPSHGQIDDVMALPRPCDFPRLSSPDGMQVITVATSRGLCNQTGPHLSRSFDLSIYLSVL